MTLQEFQQSLSANNPPAELSHALRALWWDDWNRAHSNAMLDKSHDGSRVHAYLHRKEGDRENAAGWYSRARQPFCEEPTREEWFRIAGELLARRQ